jgi:glycine/D-amino acid oxidase-like deaminating enzyme
LEPHLGSRPTRRGFLLGAAALVGLTRKGAARAVVGELVNESHVLGHRLRDRFPFQRGSETLYSPLVIVGGGIAGLSAAWRLQKRGMNDFVVLEMEPQAGGNARWGENEISAYPWAAHYVPVPGRAAGLVRELFEDLGVRRGDDWDERYLCFAPQERLFLHGRWQEGLEPQVGPSPGERDEFRRFRERTLALSSSGEFTIPMAVGARASPLDTMSMAEWLAGEGFASPYLRWQVDYACRDDYGALARDVSAWAGLHYFASREHDGEGPLTWPEGNGWIVRRLLERLGGRVRTSSIVNRVERAGRAWRVSTPGAAWITDAVIFAAPAFLAGRLIEGGIDAGGFTYSPWLTANLTLDRWPDERGFPPAWDNVIFDSAALGYVVATHQALRTYVPRTMWTYYWPLAHDPPERSRRWLLAQDWTSLQAAIFDDLSRAHAGLRSDVRRIDIMRMGHAMIRPTPGFLSSPARIAMQASGRDGLFYAHSDVSGLPLFEEAQYRGVIAAERALDRIGRG